MRFVSPPAGRRDDDRFHVAVVCSGNICRSPIGEQVLRAAVEEAGLADRVRVTSAGTGDWHVGQAADARTAAVLRRAGYPTEHRARQITARELTTVDLALAADRGHLRALRRMTTDPDKVALLRSFDPSAAATNTADSQAGDAEVPDPYYGPDSGFDEVLQMVVAAMPGLIEEIRRRMDGRAQAAAGE